MIGAVGGAFALALLMGASGVEQKLKYPSPSELALSPDGHWLFAVCEGTSEVVIIDTAANKIAGRVPVGRVPRGIALSADGKRAWVANSWDDTVTEIDVEARTAGRKLPSGFEPTGVAADRAGETLYIANRLSNDISIVNLTKPAMKPIACLGAAAPATWRCRPMAARVYSTHVYPNIGKHRTPAVSEITEVDAKTPCRREPRVAARFGRVSSMSRCRTMGGWALPRRFVRTI
jgi:YVTN family beta-propeller protein